MASTRKPPAHVSILVGVPGRPDVVVSLSPGHWERVQFAGEHPYPPHVSILLLEDASGDVTPEGKHVPPLTPPTIVQDALPIGADRG